MGCYGLGITRLMGAVVEVFNDEKGIIWPKNIAPFQIHLVELAGKNKEIKEKCKEVYEILQKIILKYYTIIEMKKLQVKN